MRELTHKEIYSYEVEAVRQMSDDDRADFLADPESWYDGITTNHVIACRDGRDIYISSTDEWQAVRDGMLAQCHYHCDEPTTDDELCNHYGDD